MKTNKLFLLIVIAALSFSVIRLIGCAQRPVKNIDSKGKTVICFGDSITAGEGVGEGEDFPGQLSQMLGVPIINAGENGDTSSAALGRLKRDVLDKQPLLVIVEFGGNDFLSKIPLEETVKNMRRMAEEIQAKGAMVAICDVSSGLIMENYRKRYKELAVQTQAIFIPSLLSGILTNPSLKIDYIHPNREGHRIFAQRIYSAVKPYLDRNNLLRKIED